MDTRIKYTAGALAEEINVKWDSFYTNLRRMHEDGRISQRYTKNDLIEADDAKEIIREYATPKPRRSDDIIVSAQELAQQKNIQVNQTNVTVYMGSKPAQDDQEPARTGKSRKKKELPESQEPEKRSGMVTVMIFAAFVFILLYQIEHIAHIGMEVSTFKENSTASKVSGWLFAVTVAVTALLMTLRRGTEAKIKLFKAEVSYIFVFALLDVIFFVLSTAPLEEGDWLRWVKSCLVALTTAFVIYSFNELLTQNN